MEKIKTAVIGCGKVADAHAHAYQVIKNSDFTAVCDIDKERAGSFAAKYGVKAYTSISEMVKTEGIKAASVCTPHPFHAQACVEAADSGCNVIVEKPFAVNILDCDKMLEAGKRNNVQVGTLFQRRFYEPCQRIKKAIKDGKIGRPILGDVTMLGWRDKKYYDSDPWRGTWKGEGGGVLPTQACHQLDLLLWFMDSDIDEVYGVWKNYNHPYIEVEDTAVAIIKFKSGALATITASNSQNPAQYGKVRVHGDNGASLGVQTDGGSMFIAGMTSITESPFNDMWTVQGEEALKEVWKKEDAEVFFRDDPTEHYHQVQIQDFIDAVSEGRKPLVSGEDGRKSAELLEAIYRSSRIGLPVKFPLEENE
ncbi:Gfo/Idh/MocA family protein [Clostridium transplantifaecale]|uniref:Gfo/Idh/MocA family protein n=1 Tax=Clostridium transplantifaecale TaxID=2479838 RepID=UPI000F63D5D3|nr:Gfo/Idh/MocA family oxidoreductase [Clostridium transplantifaecale]